MASIGSGYDLGADTFSPDGRLFQIEYAVKAVDSSGTALGIACTDGVVLGIEKLLVSRMLEPGSNTRVWPIDKQAGAVIAGLLPDGRQLVARGRAEADQERQNYGIPIRGDLLATRVAGFAHVYTLYGGARPFGASLLLCSFSDDGPLLWLVDPAGQKWPYKAVAVGKARVQAKTQLEKLLEDKPQMTCREAVQAIADIIYDVHDNAKDKLWEMEMAWVCEESKLTFQRVPKDIMEPAAAQAKKTAEGKKRDD
eukprot:TRINITY_DN5644_c0_g3_i1.p1 TRINITY_DN5644_c0_g3~~TRINITY_DN5644_c0_g3_i1.p1  ORF type:complete len:286 (+),score=110.68 TRINITY_DN5644_c0_g3_i1:100-858(+)